MGCLVEAERRVVFSIGCCPKGRKSWGKHPVQGRDCLGSHVTQFVRVVNEALSGPDLSVACKSRPKPKETCLPQHLESPPLTGWADPGSHLHSADHVPVVFQKNIVHRDLKLGNMVLNKR